jgi:acetolactate synthase I/II/III large subunit
LTNNRINELSSDGTNPAEKGSIDGGQIFLDSISDRGVDYIFYNSGSDFYPILEHFSEWDLEGRKKPERILCLSEHTALCMAHGYSMLTKRAQVVLVHAGIGILQFGGALHNAHRGRAPILLASGRAPYTFENELEGGRDSPHHWDQEVFDQAGPLREYTKWQYELKTNSNLPHIVGRALQIANSEPEGPVYLLLPRELLAEEKVSVSRGTNAAGRPKYGIPRPPEVDNESLQKMTDLLLESENPIIITEYLGRNESSVESLVRLSELLSIGVMELSRRRTNFPTTHPNYLPGFPKEDFESSDLIFLIDVDVPWIPAAYKVRSDANLIQIDIDPVKTRFPQWGFPVDIAGTGSTRVAIPRLNHIIEEKLRGSGTRKERIVNRATRLSSRHDLLRSKFGETTGSEKSTNSSNFRAVLSIFNQIKNPECIVMNEAVSCSRIVENYVDSTLPSTFFGIGGSSLGDGVANSLGLKLAAPPRDVVCFTGDGSFVYSNPVATLWTASKYHLPIIVIVVNNGGYFAMKRSIDSFYPNGVSRKTNHYAGVQIEPEPDYVAIAKACGVVGWRVENRSQIEDTLRQAFQESRAGKPVLVDVVT